MTDLKKIHMITDMNPRIRILGIKNLSLTNKIILKIPVEKSPQ